MQRLVRTSPAGDSFADLREDLLLDYGYNTARAYWADLQHWLEWAVQRNKDVLALTDGGTRQYFALLRRRKYSGSTIRRRATALRLLYQRRDASTMVKDEIRDE